LKPPVRAFVRYQLPAIVWALLIFTASSIPGTRIPNLPLFRVDKLLHAGIFLVFGILVERAFRNQTAFPLLARRSGMAALVCAVAYGLSDETHQLFVPGRSSELFDLLADAVGAIIGIFLAVQVSAFRARRRAAAGTDARGA
jgi:VanZ family protein